MSGSDANLSIPADVEVLVVGGGIQGAGIAQAAAAAGYSVLLVEKSSWASATSSNSSKLIHGGLRYLEQFQLKLVHESLRERQILCRIAPHLVTLNDFRVPIYRDTHLRPWKLWAGLALYATLAGLGPDSRFRRLPRRDWSGLDGLDTRGLQSVFSYRDGQTDDAALTRAVVASAKELGTRVACPAEMLSADGDAQGYRVRINHEGRETTVACRVLVNVAGPWISRVAERIAPRPAMPAVTLVQGSHLVMDRRLSESCYYLEAPRDQRAVFVLPWKDTTLVGTTETEFSGDPAAVNCLPAEEAYLLETLARYFPDYAATAGVTARMAGLRVLPSAGDDVHARSRDVQIHHQRRGESHYISVCGGKLTGYRATAAAVGGYLKDALGPRDILADTAHLQLPTP